MHSTTFGYHRADLTAIGLQDSSIHRACLPQRNKRLCVSTELTNGPLMMLCTTLQLLLMSMLTKFVLHHQKVSIFMGFSLMGPAGVTRRVISLNPYLRSSLLACPYFMSVQTLRWIKQRQFAKCLAPLDHISVRVTSTHIGRIVTESF